MKTLAYPFLAVVALALAGCASVPTPTPTPTGAEVFIAAQADEASYAGDTFTIGGLDSGVVLVTMAPERRAWTAEAADIPGLFGDATLNTVVIADGAEHALALSAPTYDAASGEIAFTAAEIGADDLAGSTLAKHGDALTPAEAGAWGSATVFIDPVNYNPCTIGIVADFSDDKLMVRASMTPASGGSYAEVPAEYLSDIAPDYGVSTTAMAYLDCSAGTPAVTYDVYANSLYYEPAGATPSWQYNTKIGSVTFSWNGSKAVCDITTTSSDFSPRCVVSGSGDVNTVSFYAP